jgi:hypothetical protein
MSITARKQPSNRNSRSRATAPQRRGARFRREQPSQSGIQKLLGALPRGRGKGSARGKRGRSNGILGKLGSKLGQ